MLFVVWVGSIDDAVDWPVLASFVFCHGNDIFFTLTVLEAPIPNRAVEGVGVVFVRVSTVLLEASVMILVIVLYPTRWQMAEGNCRDSGEEVQRHSG